MPNLQPPVVVPNCTTAPPHPPARYQSNQACSAIPNFHLPYLGSVHQVGIFAPLTTSTGRTSLPFTFWLSNLAHLTPLAHLAHLAHRIAHLAPAPCVAP
jgi:hypothetical protein